MHLFCIRMIVFSHHPHSNRPLLPRFHFLRAGQQEPQQQQPPAAAAQAQQPPASVVVTIEMPPVLLAEHKNAYDRQRNSGSGTIKAQYEAKGGSRTRLDWLSRVYNGASKKEVVFLSRLDDGISPRDAVLGFTNDIAEKRGSGLLQPRERHESIAAHNAYWRREQQR